MPTASVTPLHLPQRESLVTQTARSLRQNIEEGHWREEMPSERELCETLQVSRRTLRAALDELQRQGLLAVQSRQRRKINLNATTIDPGNASRVIGMLVSSAFWSPTLGYLLNSIRDRLTAQGYDVQIHAAPGCYTGPPGRGLKNLIQSHPTSAWLIMSPGEAMQRWLAEQKVPCLILGSALPGIDLPSVDQDFHAVCRHAVTHLWRKGHRRITLVLPKQKLGGDLASEVGAREAAAQLANTTLNVLKHDGSTGGLSRALTQCLRSSTAPTAFVVARADYVITVMMQLLREGKRLPQDVAVLARDDDPLLDCAIPAVARYSHPPKSFATRVAKALKQLSEAGHLEGAIRLMPSFRPGETV